MKASLPVWTSTLMLKAYKTHLKVNQVSQRKRFVPGWY
jgi:hypothetical protein